jgi:hypothetical protein
MAYFLFVDESGQDRANSPYEVLAGLSVRDSSIWPLINDVQAAEGKYFGDYYRRKQEELKAKKLLKTKVFRLASQLPQIQEPDLFRLAQSCLTNGPKAKRLELTALAQAKILYVQEVFEVCRRFRCQVFGSIIDYESLEAQPKLDDFIYLEHLRKDYAFLFERFFYYLEDQIPRETGAVIFDELEKSKSHILHSQMREYFINTRKGRDRSSLIIPEPLFVHSDLTTGIHIADLVAYCLAWGFRTGGLSAPKRDDLDPLVNTISNMRYLAKRVIPEIQSRPSDIWSIAIINAKNR